MRAGDWADRNAQFFRFNNRVVTQADLDATKRELMGKIVFLPVEPERSGWLPPAIAIVIALLVVWFAAEFVIR